MLADLDGSIYAEWWLMVALLVFFLLVAFLQPGRRSIQRWIERRLSREAG
jgi:hypothetical protein